MRAKKISILQKITEYILGKKFYICVIAQKGTSQYFVNSTIYRSMEEVLAYQKHVDELPSLEYVCCYSFRSKFDFRLRLSDGKKVGIEEAKKLVGNNFNG